MKILYRTLSAFVYLFMMMAQSGCTHEKNELAHDHSHHDHSHHDHSHHDHSHHDHHSEEHAHEHGDGDEIILEPAQAAKMGVAVRKIKPGSFAEAVRATGMIEGNAAANGVATAPTRGVFTFAASLSVGSSVRRGQVLGYVKASDVSGGDANVAAKAELESAKLEVERLKPLYEKKLVTAEKYNAAVAAYQVAQARYSPSAASGAVISPLTGVVRDIMVGQGGFVEAGSPVALVSDGSTLNLIVEVPDRYTSFVPSITDARITTSASPEPIDLSALGAKRVSPSSASQLLRPGYIPVVFSFNNDGSILPGSVAEVYLLGNERSNVLSVPLTAITEQQGNYFVYVRIDDEGYMKTPVTLGLRNGKSVEVLSGLHAGDEVVTEGVTALRLAETSGAVPEGHTHSH